MKTCIGCIDGRTTTDGGGMRVKAPVATAELIPPVNVNLGAQRIMFSFHNTALRWAWMEQQRHERRGTTSDRRADGRAKHGTVM